ncbi:phage tail tape measure C-terminal domain-containing protein [Sphingobium sp.]|uniref:phage tail tape measure C-terminal domain-containing protein n=1 Tax=Sphingobium sp. TaxID=1912891 RepID=UPI003BB663DA
MAEQTERLLLQVDAATELLRQHLSQAEPSLDRFERRAKKMADSVDRSIGEMGKRFGAFGQLAESAAERAQKSFESSFTQVQRMAATAIRGPTINGNIDLGADDIRAGAEAAQQQARAFALIEDAARSAAARIGDTSEATRLFIAATSASRMEAERKASALLAEAGALERVEIELRQSADATDLFITSHQRIAQAAELERQLAIDTASASREQKALAASATILRGELDPMYIAQQRFDTELDRADDLLRAGVISQREYAAAIQVSRDRLQAHATAVAGNVPIIDDGNKRLTSGAGALRAAMSGASYQVQDFFIQWSMGANVIQAAVIQGGQLTGQFANLDVKTGTVTSKVVAFAQFMQSGYGIGIQAALLVLTPFVAKLLEEADAQDSATEKLRKAAAESVIADAAKKSYANSIEGVTEALRDQAKALEQAARADRTSAENANISAKAERDRALATRQATLAYLEQAKARLAALSTPGASDARLAIPRDEAKANVDRFEGELKKAQAGVAEAERQLNLSRVDLAAEQAAVAIDPIRAVTKLYDDRINALKTQQREEAKLGRQVGAASLARLTQLEREKKAAVDAAQERERLSNKKLSPSANNQIGREIDVAEATRIIEGIGGRVTNGLRTTARQAELYAAKLAGTHKGPVAKPGTSDHERGQAIDIAYGPGVTPATIKAAFAREGVAIRQLLDERDQRIFHVGFGKRGPSQQTVENKEEAARQQAIARDLAFNEQERAANRRLIRAKVRGAETAEEREKLALSDINEQADAEKRRIADQLDAKKLTQAQANRLVAINEATRLELVGNANASRATRILEQRYALAEEDLDARIAMLRISEDLATTDGERRRVSREILDAEQQLRRKALERIRDTSQDPEAVARAQRDLGRLPEIEDGERRQEQRRTASPMDQYRDRLRRAAGDMDTALDSVKANGLASLEDGLVGIISGTENASDAFKRMAASIIADLARIAIQKAILSAIGGSFLGFADGGPLSNAPGFADGGSAGGRIRGPGNGRSDSILALLSGADGKAVRLSNREFIMNERAVDFYGSDLMSAINARQLPRFADGGALGTPRLSTSLRSPTLPRLTEMGRDRLSVDVRTKVDASPLLLAKVEETTVRTVAGAAEPIMSGAEQRTLSRLRRRSLPGGYAG